jgi:glycogen operon protein
MRNFLTTLYLSQGVVMLSHGDEVGRTQGGNNNAYCQDNEISWIDWKGAGLEDGEEPDNDLLDYVRELARLRREHPVFRRRRFFHGSPVEGPRSGRDGLPDIAWLRPDGKPMSGADWNAEGRVLGVFLNGEAITEPDPRGRAIRDGSFLLLLNSGAEAVEFTLPGTEFGTAWETVLDTAEPDVDGRPFVPAAGPVRVIDRALLLLRRVSHRRSRAALGS